MDLVQTVRKEGSRGGRGDFKWPDVKNDAHRENYLGHSIMAPVGRWQQGRDLTWYAKGDEESKEAEAARIAEEKRKLKEAEKDAMLAAMGLPVPVRAETNANLTPLGKRAHEADIKDAMDEKAAGGEDEDRSARKEKKERSRRNRDDDRHAHDHASRRRRHRSRSPSRDRHRDRHRRHRDRSRSYERPRDSDKEDRRRHRSRSREHKRREDRQDRPERSERSERPERPERPRERDTYEKSSRSRYRD